MSVHEEELWVAVEPEIVLSVVVGEPEINLHVEEGLPGPKGDPGPVGPPGGPTVVAVPYVSWPPLNPQPDILYLRLAP